MDQTDTETLICRLIDADLATALMAVSLAADRATTTRERQLVALAAAQVAEQHDRAGFLAREHLLDYPDSIFAAWVVAHGRDGVHPC